MKVERELVKVVIFTESYKIVGNIHIVPGGRLSDFLAARVSGNFIPVTDVKVFSANEGKLVLETKFLSVNSDFIVLVHLMKEPESEKEF